MGFDEYHLPSLLKTSILEEAVGFLNSRELISLPVTEAIPHVGVYALYYFGDDELYGPLSEMNRKAKSILDYYPIYVGKAVPIGSRTGHTKPKGQTLYHRLLEHTKSIESVGLDIADFKCRFAIMTGNEVDLIVPLESVLIRMYSPLWNSHISGFGIHHPGSGRSGQRRSEWDTVHPGRYFADTLTGEMQNLDVIKEKIVFGCNEAMRRSNSN